MTATAPPRPPAPDESYALEALDALIEEARRRARRRRLGYAAAAIGAGAIALALTLFHGGSRSGPARVTSAPVSPAAHAPTSRAPARANGALTIIGGEGISTIGFNGYLTPLFTCRSTSGCLELQSIAWSPDGRRLAFSVTGVGASSPYSGLHIYEPVTHKDRQISAFDGFSLVWSPDGSQIAYVESSQFPRPWGTIYLINADGSHRRAVETGSSGVDMSPSWSPDGRRLVFATANVDWSSATLLDSVISIVNVDGSQRTRLAPHASAPTWSPDGTTIAYRARCGIKLITPAGLDVTPTRLGCRAGTARGVPIWSPDGQKLAVGSHLGVFVVDLRGHDGVQLVTAFGTRDTGQGIFGSATPAWQPLPPPAPRT
jgi:dipeptidyl aminopeptidase/acylaminoacyl peptidase